MGILDLTCDRCKVRLPQDNPGKTAPEWGHVRNIGKVFSPIICCRDCWEESTAEGFDLSVNEEIARWKATDWSGRDWAAIIAGRPKRENEVTEVPTTPEPNAPSGETTEKPLPAKAATGNQERARFNYDPDAVYESRGITVVIPDVDPEDYKENIFKAIEAFHGRCSWPGVTCGRADAVSGGIFSKVATPIVFFSGKIDSCTLQFYI